jgi:hypothetical protein
LQYVFRMFGSTKQVPHITHEMVFMQVTFAAIPTDDESAL